MPSFSITQRYTSPNTGTQTSAQVNVDIVSQRPDDGSGSGANSYLKATGANLDDVLLDIDSLVETIIEGKPSSPRADVVGTMLANGYNDAAVSGIYIYVDSATGFSAKDCISIADDHDGTGAESRYIVSIASTKFTLNVACDNAHILGGIVQLLAPVGASIGVDSVPGIKAQLERPGTPTAAVVGSFSGAAGVAQVTITAPASDAAVITAYDVYARLSSVGFPANGEIPPNEIPVIEDVTSIASAVNANQYYNATTKALAAMAATTSYDIRVVAKDGTGQHNINESAGSTAVAVTTTS